MKKNLPIWIALSVITALGVGFLNLGEDLPFQRLFCFYPFFLLGVWCRKRGFFANGTTKKQLVGAGLILLSLVFTAAILPYIDTNWLFHSQPYEVSESTPFWRIIIMALSCLWCVGLLLASPEKRFCLISDMGRYSICVFLLHGFIQRICLYAANPFVFSQWINILMAVVVSVIICMLLGNKYIFKAIQPVTDFHFLYKKGMTFYERFRKNAIQKGTDEEIIKIVNADKDFK